MREIRRFTVWHRRLVAAALLAGSVALGLHAVAPPAAATQPVLVASRDLPGGAVLSRGDLRIARLPSAAIPQGVVQVGDTYPGRTLTGPVRAGEVITDVRLIGATSLSTYGEGVVAAPVRIADAASVRLLTTGDRVDVLAAEAPEHSGVGSVTARLVASAVTVIAVPRSESTVSGDSYGGALVVLATTAQTAARLAAAAVTASLSVTIQPR